MKEIWIMVTLMTRVGILLYDFERVIKKDFMLQIV